MNYKIGIIKEKDDGMHKIMITGDSEKATIALISNSNVDSFEITIEPGFWLLNQEDVLEIVEQLYAESLGLLN